MDVRVLKALVRARHDEERDFGPAWVAVEAILGLLDDGNDHMLYQEAVYQEIVDAYVGETDG